ncbi:MAG: acetate--CoA ligase family protein, partial [bacterium]|nr:acetate--CoA ligase family protein [bacterium]
MLVSEHHGKALLRAGGIAVPRGVVARTPEQAAAAAGELGGVVAIKAQIPAGKRGKAGGIIFAESGEAARRAGELLASSIAGFPVRTLLIEQRVEIARELYAAVMNDAATKSPLVLFSAEGGIDIEELNVSNPDAILRRVVDIRRGFTAADARLMLAGSTLEEGLRDAVADVLAKLYRQYRALDLELLEVNPLAIDRGGRAWALDCKLSVDDSARSRHPDFVAEAAGAFGPAGTELEQRGRELGLLYIELDGQVGVLANGA